MSAPVQSVIFVAGYAGIFLLLKSGVVRFWGWGRSVGAVSEKMMHSSKRGLSDGENQPDETLLISFGPAGGKFVVVEGGRSI